MLKIVGNTSYIVVNDKENDNIVKKYSENIPIPKVKNEIKLSFDKWYNKFENEINKLWEDFLYLLTNMNVSNRFICHYNMTQLKNDFIDLLYKSSDTTFKSFV